MTCSPFMAGRQTHGRGLVSRRDGVRSEDQGRSPSTVRRLVLGNWLWPAPVALRRRACPLMRNGKGEEVPFSWRDFGRFVGFCAAAGLPRRDADLALEVMGELALVGEAGVRGDLRQGEVASGLQELPGPLDAAGDDVLVRRQSGGPLELPDEVVGAEAGDRGQLLQGRATVEVLLDVLDD